VFSSIDSRFRYLVFVVLTLAAVSAATACHGPGPTNIEARASVIDLNQSTRKATLELQVSDRARWQAFTAAHVGRQLEVRVEGVLVMRPILREPIEGTGIELSWKTDDVGDTLQEALEGRERVHLSAEVTE
jgi:preprotein translocase subunit SecD